MYTHVHTRITVIQILEDQNSGLAYVHTNTKYWGFVFWFISSSSLILFQILEYIISLVQILVSSNLSIIKAVH